MRLTVSWQYISMFDALAKKFASSARSGIPPIFAYFVITTNTDLIRPVTKFPHRLMISVNSSNIASIGYVGDSLGTLYIAFHSGALYSYANVRVNLSGHFENVATDTGDAEITIEVEPNFEKEHHYEIAN